MPPCDQMLRDLLEDAAYRGGDQVAREWTDTAHHLWDADQIARMWDEFREAVISRDRLLDKPGLLFAEYHEFFDACDIADPRQETAIERKATEADDVFIRLLTGPYIKPLTAVAA